MNIILLLVLFILVASCALDLFVNGLNLRHLTPDLPGEFEGWYDAEKYKKSQQYLKDNTGFGMAEHSVLTFASIIFILAGGFNWIDQAARFFHFGPVLTGLIFAGLFMLIAELMLIPFSAYKTFVIEENYNFNRTTVRTFILDILKSTLLTAVLGGIAFSGIIWFFSAAGTWAWLFCWAGMTLFQLFIVFIAPVVILPLFNRFTPLEDSELKTAIETYARTQSFKIKGIFVMDGSQRSTKSNAMFTGFGPYRRIVLFDTLIKKHSVDELVSVLAHEMGHYKKNHVLKSITLSILSTGLMFYLLSLLIEYQPLFDAFRMTHTSIYASLFLFAFLFVPVDMIISIFSNWVSRRHEFEADAYTVNTFQKPEAMISALKRLSVDNLSNLTPHPLKVFVSYSHPPVMKRIQAIRNAIGEETT